MCNRSKHQHKESVTPGEAYSGLKPLGLRPHRGSIRTYLHKGAEEFSGWYNIHKYVAKHYDPERPLIEARLTPEYKTNSRSS